MGESNGSERRDDHLWNVLGDVDSNSQQTRAHGLKELKIFFDRVYKSSNFVVLSDKSYHKIFEVIFKASLTEKRNFLTAKKTTLAATLTRLSLCADVVRAVVKATATKLKVKTLEAVIDHLTQTLPMADGGFCAPLAPHYLKALSTILECQNNVEHLKCATWLNVVDFCLQSIDKYLEDHDAEPSGSLSRSFSGLGTSRASGLMAKSAAGNRNTQGQQGSFTKENAEELLRNLLFLVSATNAPLQERYQEVADTAIRFLQFQGSTVSQAQLLAFSIVNAVLSFTRTDQVSFSKSTAQAIVSPITRFLQGKALLKDEMWNSVRDEISILLFTVHLHLESSCRDVDASELLLMLEDLSDVLRKEYSRRSERDQIQLHDLKMTDFGAEENDTVPFRLYPFQLRPHSIKAERDWANLQFIGVVERLVNLGSKKANAPPTNPDDESDRHPNKRQKRASVSDRIIDPLKSEDEKTRMAGLQILPFVLEDCQLSSSSLTDLLIQLLHCASDKRSNIASWALLAVASCTSQNAATEIEPTHWTQLWHVGLRFLTFSSTCRAAALQLHAILAKNLVLYHDIGEAVNAIVTAADFSGPMILCDSSIFLMSHLLHAGITEAPGASLRASHHVLRWLFARWNPGMDSRIPVQPEDIMALLRTCLGLHRFDTPGLTVMPCGFTAQAWQNHLDTQDVIRYLLLLSPSQKRLKACLACPNSSKSSKLTFISNTAHFQSVRKLLLELLQPKSSGILQSWRSFVSDRSGPVSADTFRNDIYSCITILLSTAHFSGASSPELHNLEEDAKSLAKEIVRFLGDEAGRDPKGAETLTEVFLQSIQPFLPPCGASEFLQLSELESYLLEFFIMIAEVVDTFRGVPTQASSGPNDDLMDLDDFGSSQSSRKEGPKTVMQRKQLALDRGPASYYLVITNRLKLLAAMQSAPEVKGFVPSSFVEQLVSLLDEEFLSSRRFIHELLFSDLLLEGSDAARVVEHIAVIITSDGLDRCEPALGLCLDILEGLVDLWSIEDGSDVSDAALQCYGWFITAALGNDIVSPGVQKDMANLLLLLLRAKPDYGTTNSLSSPRSSLFMLLQKSSAYVKFHIGTELPQIFNLFLLKDHDEIFVDVLENLPQSTDWIEGIHFRLFVFSKLASSWPTLLRRCMYHLFEAPGRIPECIKHAARCLEVVSIALKVDGPRELFTLFASQLLYTWLEAGEIRDIPFQVFGFLSLQELVTDAQEEIVALMIMRDQDEAVEEVARILRADEGEILQRCFTKIIAYSIAHDISTPPPRTGKKSISGEVRLKKRLGELFFQCVNQHFADIVGVLFNTIDPESNVEKYLVRKKETEYAAKIMGEIKSLNSSDVMLPPTQQPTFKAKYLVAEINHLCTRTPHEPSSLYTPALFTSVARRLLNTIHPALGSLHACSVLRKLRILISLAGSSAIVGYPLEMLLQAVQPFITNPECTDDAIGIIQYLLSRGSVSLLQRPTFVAGIALSILGSLRTFLDSTRASTTQESQYKNTMSKARAFHTWVGEHLNHYNSPALRSQQRPDFHMLMKSALRTESIGNADNGTPESHLLLQLLKDEKAGGSLLSRPARKLALRMLCSEFQAPGSFRTDILGNDELSIANAAVVWKSCRGASASKQYLSWAAKVLGRAFVASGHVHEELLQESRLTQIKELSPPSEEKVDSRVCVLNLLQELTLEDEPRTVGLAETALRVIVSSSDDSLMSICNYSLSDPLSTTSQWNPYEIPPSDLVSLERGQELDRSPLDENSILQEHWLRNLSIFLAQSVPDDILLAALVPILQKVSGFADQAFPFIIHLVLSAPSQGHRKALSSAFSNWFNKSEEIERNHLKMLLNAILYLRTQPLPDEKSSADRSRWLDLDYLKASIAAAQCGMFKTALIFVEESCSQSTKSSRRSSAVRDIDQAEIPTELLLTIFQNIDDPDMYYGVQQNASLSTILARFEYEKDGSKTLAFRGAQYDSHVRRQNPESTQDAQSLVKALDVLSLSGLSNSLLQAQQTVGMTPESLESMFRTARKLEQWDLPVPTTSSSNSVTIYKTFQAIHTALEPATILQAVNDGLEQTMSGLVQEDLSASALHDSLQTLAALVEMDEVLSSRGSEQFEDVLSRFKGRSRWMNIGRFDDVSQILSCRGTTLSTLSQQIRLQEIVNIKTIDTRLVEVHTALLASAINQSHNALQESLSLATSMMDLIEPCHQVGINPEIAIHLEAANALWDQGEMASSIGMLQALDNGPALKNQTDSIAIGRSDLLSKIGYQVSVARLEKADRIIEKYLRPALKELRGNQGGDEAGQVFHQFAVFCDQQLQDPDSLEDLERLKKLSKNKREEVEEYAKVVKEATSSTTRARYQRDYDKAKIWLKLDEEELQRHISNREEFLRQCLENYLLALSASDKHDSNALRFSALWLQHSEEQLANDSVSKHLSQVPSRKFAPLMNQLASRLQDSQLAFQQLLFKLVLQICIEHPYHGMYHIYSGANSRIASKDDSALSRRQATSKVATCLRDLQATAAIWQAINNVNKMYCALAAEKDEQKYKSGRRIALKDSTAATRLNMALSKSHIPSPTMSISLSPTHDYSKLPHMTRLESQFAIASGVSAPKVITALASDGAKFKQLVKGGNDDLRQDAIMEQVFEQVSELLKTNQSTRERNLSIRTYRVLPLTNIAGVIEFVPNTIPLHDYLMPAHERYYPKDFKGPQCRKEIAEVQTQSVEVRVKKFRAVTERFHPVMRYFFTEKFDDPDEWFLRRLAYTRSTAAVSILGYVLGLGDRHGHNILLDSKSGEVVHIDLGIAFETGRVLAVPELVPFRLTRDIVDGMGITKTEGVFRRCCEFTLEALRKEVYSIMTILDVLRYDPLYSWSASPVRLAKLQEGQSAALAAADDGAANERTKEVVNEPGEADRALTVVNKKLSKTLSVTATVNDLINQATDVRNLAVLFSGWAAYA